MAHDVFISYSTKDKLTADAVCATLEGRGIRCWIAPRDILPGMDWGEAIIDAIAESRVMVLVFSENANQSPQIKREVERAVNKGVAVVPVRIQDVPMSKSLEFFVSTPHWMDALTPPLERHLVQLADTLRLLLERMGPRKGALPAPTDDTARAPLVQEPVAVERRVEPQSVPTQPPAPKERVDEPKEPRDAHADSAAGKGPSAQSEATRTAEPSTTATPPPRPDTTKSPPPIGKSTPPARPPPRPPQRTGPGGPGPFPFVNKIFGPVSPGMQVLIVVGGGVLVLTILSCLFFSCLGGLAQ